MQVQVVAAYALLSSIVVHFGWRHLLGFIGFFLIVLLFTPLLTGLILAISSPKTIRD